MWIVCTRAIGIVGKLLFDLTGLYRPVPEDDKILGNAEINFKT